MNVREDFTITEKAPTKAFSWLKPTITFTFKNLLRHYAKRVHKQSKYKVSRHKKGFCMGLICDCETFV